MSMHNSTQNINYKKNYSQEFERINTITKFDDSDKSYTVPNNIMKCVYKIKTIKVAHKHM